MVLRSDSRSVHLLRARLSITPEDASETCPHSAADLLNWIVQSYRGRTDVRRVNEHGTIKDLDRTDDQLDPIYIADIHESEHALTFVINLGDANTPDMTYLHRLERNQLRNTERGAGETPGYSAHVLVKRMADDDGSHRVLLEQVPNLSRTLIVKYLETLVKGHVNTNYPALEYNAFNEETGEFSVRKYRMKLDLALRAGASIRQDIPGRRFTSIALIERDVQLQGPDRGPRIKGISRRLNIQIEPTGIFDQVFGLSQGLIEREPGRYDELQLEMHGLPGGKSKTAKFAIDQLQAAELHYSRLEHIADFNEPLPQATSTANLEFIEKLQELSEDETLW
jgi:hypothetical protein